MARATKICPQPGCTQLMPCTVHERKPWATSQRRQRTISGSMQQKRARRVIRRDHTICHICGLPGATQADHVTPLAEGGLDTVANMKAIHPDCHHTKTQQEAQRGRLSA